MLPLSFGSPDSVPTAAALLLLNHVTAITPDTAAVFRDEALTQLGIVDVNALNRLEPLERWSSNPYVSQLARTPPLDALSTDAGMIWWRQ